MKIVDRYILTLFLKIFFSAIAVLLVLFTMIAFFELVDDFIRYKAALFNIAVYLLFRLPEALLHMAPMAVLIASILTFSLMSRNREVVLMMSCGLSALRISAPVIAAALTVSLLLMFNVEYLMPVSWKESRRILREEIKGLKSAGSNRQNFIWLRTPTGAIWNISLLDASAGALYDVTVVEFTPGWGRFTSVTSAEKAFERNGQWVFQNGTRRTFASEDGLEEEAFVEKSFTYDMDIEDLKQVERKPQEMSLMEIRAHAKRVREAGHNDTRYIVDMYSKIFFPLAAVIMAFIAVPFSLKPQNAEGVLMGITASVFIGFLFWFLFSMGLSMGYSGRLHPVLAAGGTHLLFILGGAYAMISHTYMKS